MWNFPLSGADAADQLFLEFGDFFAPRATRALKPMNIKVSPGGAPGQLVGGAVKYLWRRIPRAKLKGEK
jgi:hypothetical protein